MLSRFLPAFNPIWGAGGIGPGSGWGILDHLQSGSQRFINHAPKGRAEFCRNSFRFVQNIIVYGQCGSHNVIIASFR